MKFLKNLLKRDSVSILKLLIILTASVGIAVSPFVVDYNTLPRGYELPKVLFFQIICSIIILLSTIAFCTKSFKEKSIKISRSFWIISLISVLFIVSTLLSPHLEIAIWGNYFRLQGAITYLLLLWGAYGVYKSININTWHIISLSFIFSTIIQCGVALNQFNELSTVNPDAILQGIWVNGTFGQANWFAGRLLLAIILSAFYFGLRLNTNRTLRVITKVYFGLLIFGFLVTLGLTYSEWGIISAAFAIGIILLYEVLPKRIFAIILTLVAISLIIGAIFFLRLNTEYNLRIEIYNSILNIFTQPLSLEQLKIILFGFGFDTLGEVFKDYGLIKGLLVDRAHNFLLDILTQNGLIVLSIFTAFILNSFINMFNKKKVRMWDFTFIGVIAWMFRSLIHENGIINIIDFLFLLAILFSLKKELHRFNRFNTQ